MINIKLYEGFISDFYKDRMIVKDLFRNKIEECLQVLTDEFELEYNDSRDFDYFSYKISQIEVSKDLSDALINAEKKLRQNGSTIFIQPFSYKFDEAFRSASHPINSVDDFYRFIEEHPGAIIGELSFVISDTKA